MTKEFKIKKFKDATVYTLESATGMGSGSIASVSSPIGGVRRRGDNLIAQEEKKEAPKPRNFVAKNAKMGGAGQHKDKKKEQKQGNEKHKKPYMEDHEVSMASNELKSIHSDAKQLLGLVQQYGENGDLEAWQQSKITKAADYLNSVLQSIGGEQGVDEAVEDRTSYQVAKVLSNHGITYDPAKENELIKAIGMVLVKELNMSPREARAVMNDEDFLGDTMGELRHMEQGVAEDSLEEVDRRGFLKGMGAAALAGAAGGAKAGMFGPEFTYDHINRTIAQGFFLYNYTKNWEGKENIAQGILKQINEYVELNPIHKQGVEKTAQMVEIAVSSNQQTKPELYDTQRTNSLKHVSDITNKLQDINDKLRSGKKPKNESVEQAVAEGDRPFRGVGGAFNRGDDERHDLDPTEWYIVKDGKMFKTSVYPNQVQQAIAQGYSRTRDEAKAKADNVEESGLQYYTGVKKHGKEYMTKAAQLARDGASQEELGALKDRLSKAHKGKDNNEEVEEAAKKGLYYYVNKRKKAGTSRPANSSKAPTAQAWKDAAKTAKKESAEDDYMESLAAKLAEKIPKNAPVDVWIKDFEKSNAPQFRGKNLAKRKQMAVAASYAAKNPSKKK